MIKPNPAQLCFCACSADHVEGESTTSPETKETIWDSRVIMVEEHLLGALLANSAATPSTPRRHPAGKTPIGGRGSGSPRRGGGKVDGGGCEPTSAAEGMDAMEVQGARCGDASAVLPNTCAVGEKAPMSSVTGFRELPHAVQVVASMVNRVMQV